ncbi:TetR/AcrR family transcriptional regulator [Shewanella sp. C32]|uniref:TetR/AcrR family transcriptional regulator n=1 Tax=Shewanella electrica TaxID=515560 RepID=A0ABT2FMV8_9GAMM|nr:TetR/AcrR family transcriptional regulator [Shewanella electrica]MCH1925803.1 TetR/AcrR family transcriptional regulator [Shewanella electrica]MCS4557312.1 TetR/AcrR family transcriptional regulator [Shewanella electrica]
MPTNIIDASAAPVCDARIERTRARLAEAVLTLASERDIASVSVAELTRCAGVNRGTFYDHAQSPAALLTHVLTRELDEVRRVGMDRLRQDGLLLRHLTRSTLQGIFQHVLTHEQIYAGPSHSTSVYALRVVLADHIEQSTRQILSGGFAIPPMMEPHTLPLFASYLAHGVVGALEAWLRLPTPRDEEMLLAVIEAMYPTWLAPENAPTANDID